MRFHGDGVSSPLGIPGDNSFRDKFDPTQDDHREKFGMRSRYIKPPYLTDEEWEQIRINPGEMNEPHPEWDEKCQGKCCQEVSDDRLTY